MRKSYKYFVGLAIGGVLPLIGIQSAASAARPPAAPATRSVHGPSFEMAGQARLAGSTVPTVKDTSFAGYFGAPTTVKTVSATMIVPEITTCGATAQRGMGPVVILEGTSYFVGAGAEAICFDGSTIYQIAVNYNGSEVKPLKVKAKDKILVTITVTTKNADVSITDVTTKQKTSKAEPLGKISGVLLGDDTLVNSSTNQQYPIPAFTDHRFSSCKINGVPLVKAKGLERLELVKGKVLLVLPSTISTTGETFIEQFKHAG